MKKLMILLLLVVSISSCKSLKTPDYDIIVSGKVAITDNVLIDIYKEYNSPKDTTAVQSLTQWRYANHLPYFIVNILDIPELRYKTDTI
jgi:hypothetical protein